MISDQVIPNPAKTTVPSARAEPLNRWVMKSELEIGRNVAPDKRSWAMGVAAAAEGFDSIELVKRFTTATMGPEPVGSE